MLHHTKQQVFRASSCKQTAAGVSVVDPGFPVGGHGPHGGAVDPQGGYVSKILHVKTKESGPIGGAHTGCTPLDLPMGI